MPTFSVFTYMFSPITQAGDYTLFPDEAEPKNRYETRHQALGDFFEEKENLFHIEANHGPHLCKMLLKRDGVVVMRLANNKKKRREYHFEMVDDPDEPSCIVVLDNRPDGGQTVCIEQAPRAFSKPQLVANILEEALNKHLMGYRLRVGINAKYSTQSFWQTVDRHPGGIVRVKFHFPYPNMAEISDRILQFKEIALETNSEPEFTLNGQHKENLVLSSDNLFIKQAIEACAASGKAILITPRGKKQVKVDVLNHVSEEASEAIFEKLDNPDFFDSGYTKLLEFLKDIKLVYDD